MTRHDVETLLRSERRNPLRWVIGSKAIWIGLTMLLGVTASLLIARALGAEPVTTGIAVPIYLLVVIGFFYSRGWLRLTDFDFCFSDQWLRSASELPGVSEIHRQQLMEIAVMNSGKAALQWVDDIRC